MDKCPKCGKKLSLFYVKQECSDCGCDLLNFEREKNLEADAQQAEEEFAKKVDELAVKDSENVIVEQEIERISAEQQNVDSKKSKASESKKQASDNFGKLRAERDELFEKMGNIKILKLSKND